MKVALLTCLIAVLWMSQVTGGSIRMARQVYPSQRYSAMYNPRQYQPSPQRNYPRHRIAPSSYSMSNLQRDDGYSNGPSSYDVGFKSRPESYAPVLPTTITLLEHFAPVLPPRSQLDAHDGASNYAPSY